MVARVALIGLPGAGKSTVALLLARRLGFGCVDLDREIERVAGATVAAIIDARGEEEFRELESRALEGAIVEAGGPGGLSGAPDPPGRVVACGGGILNRAGNRALLKRGAWVAWLRVDPMVAAQRLAAQRLSAGGSAAGGSADRPLLRGAPLAERLQALLDARAAAYAGAADVEVKTGERTPVAVAEAIVPLWEAFRGRWGSSGS